MSATAWCMTLPTDADRNVTCYSCRRFFQIFKIAGNISLRFLFRKNVSEFRIDNNEIRMCKKEVKYVFELSKYVHYSQIECQILIILFLRGGVLCSKLISSVNVRYAGSHFTMRFGLYYHFPDTTWTYSQVPTYSRNMFPTSACAVRLIYLPIASLSHTDYRSLHTTQTIYLLFTAVITFILLIIFIIL